MNTATQLSLAFGLERPRRTAWEKAAMFGTIYGMSKSQSVRLFGEMATDKTLAEAVDAMEHDEVKELIDSLMELNPTLTASETGRVYGRSLAESWIRGHRTLGR